MAAVLCNGIGKVFGGACDALGTAISLPFKACGFACDGVTKAMKSPFCLYLTVALGLNIPPIIFAGQAFASNGGCSVAINWLAVNTFLCVVNMAAAIYISGKIAHDPTDTADVNDIEAAAKNKSSEQSTVTKSKWWPLIEHNHREKTCSRVRDVLCYDTFVAVYIVIGVFYIIWQSMGVGRMNEAAACEGGLDGFMSSAILCGFLFMSFGATAFSCSVCCLRVK